MFSAIVAMILIMTSVVLTSTLITTEEKTSRQIYSMLNNYQLADAANLARADALQSFNYNFREQLESYLTYDEVKLRDETGFPLFTIRTGSETFTWEQITKTFEETILLTGDSKTAASGQKFDAAISYVANRTIEQFSEGSYGRFSVYLSDKSANAKDILRRAIVSSMEKSKNEGKDFLEVVGCAETNCPIGTFYFNIPLANLSDEQYESLPRIIVKDLVTQEEIKMAILPKTNLRVYIPLRFFKALWEARKSANAIKDLHANGDLAKYKLGFCAEDAKCQPRKDPLGRSFADWTKDCPTTGSEKADLVEKAGVSTYTVGGGNTGVEGLAAYGATDVCEKGYLYTNGFVPEQSDTGFTVMDKELPKGQSPRRVAIANCGYNTVTVSSVSEINYNIEGSVSGTLFCARIRSVSAEIVFQETNPKYLVKGTYQNGTQDLYKIQISDQSYAPSDKKTASDISAKCTSAATTCKNA